MMLSTLMTDKVNLLIKLENFQKSYGLSINKHFDINSDFQELKCEYEIVKHDYRKKLYEKLNFFKNNGKCVFGNEKYWDTLSIKKLQEMVNLAKTDIIPLYDESIKKLLIISNDTK